MLHITIIDDGEVKMDLDTKGIIAAIDDDDTTRGACLADGLSGGDIMNLIATLDEAKNSLFKEHPELKLLKLLEERSSKKEKKSDAVTKDSLIDLLDELLKD